jgi:hypothetical protein
MPVRRALSIVSVIDRDDRDRIYGNSAALVQGRSRYRRRCHRQDHAHEKPVAAAWQLRVSSQGEGEKGTLF